MQFVSLTVAIVIGLGWAIHAAMQEKAHKLTQDALRRAENDAQHANDAREVVEGQLRHYKALTERLTRRLEEHEGIQNPAEATLRRFSDKFDKGAGKPLPFPKLFDANAM